jgi:uncharacterized delta-60 repeat protein
MMKLGRWHGHRSTATRNFPQRFQKSTFPRVDGSLDTGFGSGGKVMDSGGAIALQPDGQIVMAGAVYTNGSFQGLDLARHNVNGSVDTSFGSDGKVVTGFCDAAQFAGARAVAVQADGQIVAAGGFTDANGSAHFALARYQGK